MAAPITPLDTIIQALKHPMVDPKSGILTKVWSRQLQILHSSVVVLVGEGGSLIGTHLQRLAQSAVDLPDGELWYETDRTVSYIAGFGTDWTYTGGVMSGNRVDAPADLGAADVGFLFMCSDFGHLVRWTGAAWEFAAGDIGPAFFQDFATAPDASRWALCDGSATTYLTVGAALGTAAFTTPNLVSGGPGATGAYRKGGAAYSGTVVTNTGAMTGAGAVDPAHIVVLPYFRR